MKCRWWNCFLLLAVFSMPFSLVGCGNNHMSQEEAEAADAADTGDEKGDDDDGEGNEGDTDGAGDE